MCFAFGHREWDAGGGLVKMKMLGCMGVSLVPFTWAQLFVAAVCPHLNFGQRGTMTSPDKEVEVPCLGCREEFPVTGLSRPEAAGEAARGGTCIEDRTVLVPAPSTVSWLVVHTYRQVEMRGLRRSDEIPHDFQSQPSSGRVNTVYMIMYNPDPQRSPPARLYALHV